MKKTICMILALVLCFGLLVGCGAKEETPAPAPGGNEGTSVEDKLVNTSGSSSEGASTATPPPAEAKYKEDLVLLIDDKVAILDPTAAGSNCSQMGNVYHMCYDTLITYTLEGTYEPGLATEWTANEDYTEFTFKLREGVKYHNGETFTADDVVYTFERSMANPGCPNFDRANQIESIETPDDYTVIFKMKQPAYDWYYDMANPVGFIILNREAMDADAYTGAMVGTGPWAVSEFVTSESITYTRNDDYFGEKPYAKTFKMLYIAEDTARYIMFDNDEADWVVINSVYIPQYSNDPNYVMSSVVVNNPGYYAMNTQKAPFDDINFRLACAHATNDEEIVALAFSGFAAAHDTGAMWGWTSAYKDTSIPKYEYNVELAKEYLAKSSYDGRKITLAASMPHTKRIAAAVQGQLTAIGINCELYECDGPTLTAQSMWGHDLDIIVNSHVFSPLANSIDAAVTIGHQNNKAQLINQEANDLAAKARVTPDGEEREAMYHRIQEILHEECAYVTTAHNMLYTCGWKGTGGAKFFSTAYNDYSLAYRIIEE